MLTPLHTPIHHLTSDWQSCYDPKIQNHRYNSAHAWNVTSFPRYNHCGNSVANNRRQTGWPHPLLMGLLSLSDSLLVSTAVPIDKENDVMALFPLGIGQ
jgi:hypothetical protein